MRIQNLLAAIILCCPVAQFGYAEEVTEPIFRPSASVTIKDGHFGPLRKFQEGLLRAADSCHIKIAHADTFVDGRLGNTTADIIKKLSACPKIESELPSDDPAALGFVSEALWKVASFGTPPPTAMTRAKMMTGANEATDYTDIEFNAGTTDPGILTWGPYGATAGQAFQVQRILTAIDTNESALIDRAFTSEASSVRLFATHRSEIAATSDIRAVIASPARRKIWVEAFQTLGAAPQARSIYDAIMEKKGTAGVPEAVRDFFESYAAYCWKPTEIDYAFFFDRAIQMDVRRTKTNAALAAVAGAEVRLKRNFSPAERRRAISANFLAGNTSFVGDRLARDVAFYIDALGPATLTDASLYELRDPKLVIPDQFGSEVKRWKTRMGLSAADFGLSDDRLAIVPPGVTAFSSVCKRSDNEGQAAHIPGPNGTLKRGA